MQKRRTSLQGWLGVCGRCGTMPREWTNAKTSLALASSLPGTNSKAKERILPCEVLSLCVSREEKQKTLVQPTSHLSLPFPGCYSTRAAVWAHTHPPPVIQMKGCIFKSFVSLFQDICVALERHPEQMPAGHVDDRECYRSYCGTHGWVYS